MYYKLYTNENKIHTLIAFPLLFIVLLVIFFVTKTEKPKVEQKQDDIKMVEISNLTDSSADICWISEEGTSSTVIYGLSPLHLENQAYDSRDLKDSPHDRLVQCAPIKDLEENTQYYFAIEQKDRPVGKKYSFTTTAKFGLAQQNKPLFFKVFDKKGQPLSDGVVLVKIPGAYTLSSFVKSTGEVLVPLSRIVSDTKTLMTLSGDSKINIQVYDQNGESSQIETTADYISNLPPIIIGREYVIDSQTTASGDKEKQKISKKEKTDEDQDSEIEIYYPAKNAAIPGDRPIFKGSVKTADEIALEIDGSRGGTTILAVDADGLWKYTPPVPLAAGRHEVILKVFADSADEQIIRRSFSIIKSGLNVLGDATPEATMTPLPTNTPEPTQEITAVPTQQEVVTPSPPVPGFDILPFSVISLGLVITGLGLLIIF